MPSDSKKVVIVGGGVIGLCTGYYLSRAGHSVTIIDRVNGNCSERNAGMVVPSHFIPLAAPGAIGQGLRWMLDRKSPFFLRPRLDRKLWRWCWQFFRSANQRHVANTRELLRDLSLESRAEFVRLSEELQFPLVQKGLTMLCHGKEALHEEAQVAKAAKEIGIEAEVCSPERLKELEPDIAMNVAGGVWFPQDCHLDPLSFLGALRREITGTGGTFVTGEVKRVLRQGDSLSGVELQNGDFIEADEFVLAGGFWTPELAEELGVRLSMQGGKGYSFTLVEPRQLPELCYLLKEGRVAVTPMNGKLRVAGTMEICGNDLSVDRVRLSGIVSSFCQFFPEFKSGDFDGLEPWSGLRPCTPDGLPYIGRPGRWRNVTVATGHAMQGLSLGPVTGKLVADVLGGKPMDQRVDPGRFG